MTTDKREELSMDTASGRCLSARATHASHRAAMRLGLSVGIAIALSGCTDISAHDYGPPMLCWNAAEGGVVSLEPYFYFKNLRSYRYRDRYGVERYVTAPLSKAWKCPASAIEARRAADAEGGAVGDESAVPKADAHTPKVSP